LTALSLTQKREEGTMDTLSRRHGRISYLAGLLAIISLMSVVVFAGGSVKKRGLGQFDSFQITAVKAN
jgi:hypothetical protein